MNKRLTTIFALSTAIATVSFGYSSAQARVYDKQIEAARLCTKYFPEQERLKGIPTHLLAAIASVESGRWNEELNMSLPWPWTINVEGKGYYLSSKAEAVSRVKELLKKGVRSIDVGCMQVNLKHHPRAFATLDQAFDPQYNVAYAAKFLRSNYEETNSWTRAAAAYHSRTAKEGKKYLARIEGSWSNIVGRVRKARANRDVAAIDRSGARVVNVAQAELDQFDVLQRHFAEEKKRVIEEKPAEQQVAQADEADKPSKARAHASMRVIELSSRIETPKSGVMVIRPTDAVAKDAGDAKAKEEPAQADAGESSSAKERHLASVRDDLFVMDKLNASKASQQETGVAQDKATTDKVRMPTFVFVD